MINVCLNVITCHLLFYTLICHRLFQKKLKYSIFILENIIFQDVVLERYHSITPSLLHWVTPCYAFGTPGELPFEKVRNACRKI